MGRKLLANERLAIKMKLGNYMGELDGKPYFVDSMTASFKDINEAWTRVFGINESKSLGKFLMEKCEEINGISWEVRKNLGKNVVINSSIAFDDYTFDDDGNCWSQICEDETVHPEVSDSYRNDHGSGICGVMGCRHESPDTTVYVDFGCDLIFGSMIPLDSFLINCGQASHEYIAHVREHYNPTEHLMQLLGNDENELIGLLVDGSVKVLFADYPDE